MIYETKKLAILAALMMMRRVSGLGRGLVPDQRRPRPPPALHLRQARLPHLRGSILLSNSPFCQATALCPKVEGLEAYLNHPVRRHLLVRSLPQRMLDKLLYQRKYMFSAHKLATWLSYLGLVQFSPQTLKEKDQVGLKIELPMLFRN